MELVFALSTSMRDSTSNNFKTKPTDELGSSVDDSDAEKTKSNTETYLPPHTKYPNHIKRNFTHYF